MHPIARQIGSSAAGRWAVAIGASVRNSRRLRIVSRVSPLDEAWMHRGRGVSIPSRNLVPIDPREVEAQVRDIFLWRYTPVAGDIVLDVGAGIGTETLMFSRLVGPGGRVVSVEAHPGTFRLLRHLVSANALSNVAPVQGAITDRAGEVRITDGASHVGNSIMGSDGGIAVRALTLGELLTELGIERVDLLKMNIEGAETAALRGAPEVLALTNAICVSCHDFLADAGGPAWTRTKRDVRRLLEDAGFSVSSRPDHPSAWGRDYLYGIRAPE